MKHAVLHDLGQEKAKQVAEAAFSAYRDRFAKYKPVATWVDDQRANITFNVKGMTLSGTLEVSPRTIDMELDVPFLLKPFKQTAIGIIEGEIKKWVSKAKAGEI
jgi:hypothetical protein